MITETVYLGKDNTNDIQLKADGAAEDLASITRMVLKAGNVTIDSAVHPTAFDWDTGTTGKVILALGLLMDGEEYLLSPGVVTAKLTVFDASNPDGVYWGSLKLDVRDAT